MNCDICCTEPSFCRDCSCVLCCKSIASSYSFIKCEAPVSEGYICGHVAHMDCALRSYLAGTVGGSIGLDAEYHCRRCDMRTDLVSHVARLLKTCESVDSRDDIEKILGVGICILRGSRKASAKKLLNQLELAMTKVRYPCRIDKYLFLLEIFFPFSFSIFSKTSHTTIWWLLSLKVGLLLKIFGKRKLTPWLFQQVIFLFITSYYWEVKHTSSSLGSFWMLHSNEVVKSY